LPLKEIKIKFYRMLEVLLSSLKIEYLGYCAKILSQLILREIMHNE